jgi:hypothetical protein
MKIARLSPHPSIETNPKLSKQFSSLQSLLEAIGKKEVPEVQLQKINEIIGGINVFSGTDQELIKAIKAGQSIFIKLLEKELKIVPQNHYQMQWMVLGMSVFGLLLGVAFGAAMGNMGLLGIGLPIGMAIGIAVGKGMDTKAKNEGRQLDWKSS